MAHADDTAAVRQRHASAADSPWRCDGRPALVAHRGYARRYPENTLLSLAAAICSGARFLEFDIQLTSDQVPVLCHDETLARMAGDPRTVHDLSLAELRSLRASQPDAFGERFRHLPFSTLAEAVEHLNVWPRATSFVEIKRHSCERFGAAAATRQVLETLAPLAQPHVVLSFVADVVDEAKTRPGQLTGWVLRDYDDAHRQRLHELLPDYVFCNANKVPAGETLWAGPWRWVIYEITDGQAASAWRARGAAMIETMAVGEMLDAPPFCGQPAAC